MSDKDHVVFCPECRRQGRRGLRTFASLRALNIHLRRAHGAQYRYGEFGGRFRRFLGVKPAELPAQFD